MKGNFRILKTKDKVYVLVPESQAIYLETLLCTTYKGLDNSITRKINDMTSNKSVASIEMEKWSSRMGQVFEHSDDDDSGLIQTAANAINEVPERKKKADDFVKDVMGEVFGKVTYDKSGPTKTGARPDRRRRRFDEDSSDEEEESIAEPLPVVSPPPTVDLRKPNIGGALVPVGRDEVDRVLDNAQPALVLEGVNRGVANIIDAMEGRGDIRDQMRNKSKFRIFIDTGIQWSAILLFLGMLGVVETFYEVDRQSDVKSTWLLNNPNEMLNIWSDKYFPDYGDYWEEGVKFYNWNYNLGRERNKIKGELEEYYDSLELERVAKEIWYSDSDKFVESVSKSVTATESLSEFSKRMWASDDKDFVYEQWKKLDDKQKHAVGLSGVSMESLLYRFEFMEENTKYLKESPTKKPMDVLQNSIIYVLNDQYKDFTNYLNDDGKYSVGYRLDTQSEDVGVRPIMLNWAKLTRVYENSAYNLFTDFFNVMTIAVDYTGMGVSKYAKFFNNDFLSMITGVYDEHIYSNTREFRREMYKALGIMIVFLTPTISEFVGAGKNIYKFFKLKSERAKIFKNVGYNLKSSVLKVSDMFLMSGMVATAYSTLALLKAADNEGLVSNFQSVMGEARTTSYYMANLGQLFASYLIRRYTSTDKAVSTAEAARIGSMMVFLMSLTEEKEPSTLIEKMANEGQLVVPFMAMAGGIFNGLFVLGSFTRRQLSN